MSFFNTTVISGSGMSVQRRVMDVISENLANVNTVQTEEGGPYVRKIPIISAKNKPVFSELLNRKFVSIAEVSGIEKDGAPPKIVYEPNHPLADENGYLKKPNINVADEMINMIIATRAYEANVAVFNASKSMANKTLQIGA